MKNRIYIIFILIILQLNIIAVPCKTYASSDIVGIQTYILFVEIVNGCIQFFAGKHARKPSFIS